MPIFRILNLGNEVPNLVFEFRFALVFLGLSMLNWKSTLISNSTVFSPNQAVSGGICTFKYK